MNSPAIPAASFPEKDAEHLRLLAMFHFINGALDLVMLGLFGLQYMFMRAMFTHAMHSPKANDPPPEFILDFFLGFFVLLGFLYLVAVVLNVMTGFFIEQRRHRTFSMVVAGLNCVQMPLGTLLGIFTLIILNRDTVRARYAAASVACTAPSTP